MTPDSSPAIAPPRRPVGAETRPNGEAHLIGRTLPPPRFPTVLDAFVDSLEANPGGLALQWVINAKQVEELSFADLHDLAARAAAGFHAHGLRPGDRVILALPTCRELFGLYLGALFRGIIPLVEPVLRGSSEERAADDRLETLRRALGCPFAVVPDPTDEVADAEPPEGEANAAGRVPAGQLFAHGRLELLPLTVRPDDIAHLQSTSGSTGQQKMAVVSHRNIVANIRAIGACLDVRPDDKLCIWLPLYHDMGLIAVACTFYWQRPMVLTDPSNFVRHPIRYWLELISEHRATITAAPSSAYHTCARLARRRSFALDLAHLRAAFWGAEPIHPQTLRDFERTFAPQGYRPQATLPVYGLAEATLGVSIADVEQPARIRRFEPAEVTAVGGPLPLHEIRVVDAGRRDVAEGEVGEIEVRGPGVVRGYWQGDGPGPPCAEADGFLATGDLGFVRDGDLHVVGRKKDILIVRGRNFLPDEVETIAEAAAGQGLAKGVAAFAMADPSAGTEAVHLLIETRKPPPPDQAAHEEAVREALSRTLGLQGLFIHWVAKGAIPKTTSGKIQRFRCREMVTAGEV